MQGFASIITAPNAEAPTELVGREQPEMHVVVFCGLSKLTFVLLEFDLGEQLLQAKHFGGKF